ncbi:hypothetical protein SEVIR_6G032600v4 [Setaria viridis]|uniref:F-box domain-containing protein n=2 Tax=Setaria viridis TaxID=4556 RepID=A0A4U6U577_SETVI|nr:putative F-box/LRR-repeat protein 23 [Setaria viridis]XP_034599028.1 putative F-box/LRR-repeat protein 23 [Setaria viridis]TKW08509.1 hypothetical protein SEVIR_6G032600v2 [Setaria viridis]TKW08510.1 hypothetical protein SEVIR_6G032600v2 [Setaria viridis]
MDVEPSLLTVSSVRDWSELPLDALSTIFMKLGTIEILMGAGLVCRSWLAAAKSPELWRFVDMTGHKMVNNMVNGDPGILCAMAKVAIDRSDGQMESFRAQLFVTSELLDYIESRANSLKSIQLTNCWYLWTQKLSRFASKCPLLEEIEFSYQKMLPELIRHLGSVHPNLKCLRISLPSIWQNGVHMEYDESWEAGKNEEAFAIAESLHELRFLQMAGRCLSNDGVYAIIQGCPHLECLDITKCCHVYVNDELRAHCAKIKCVLFPKRAQIKRTRRR